MLCKGLHVWQVIHLYVFAGSVPRLYKYCVFNLCDPDWGTYTYVLCMCATTKWLTYRVFSTQGNIPHLNPIFPPFKSLSVVKIIIRKQFTHHTTSLRVFFSFQIVIIAEMSSSESESGLL